MIWQLNTGKLRTPSSAHDKAVWSVAFSPDGKQIASGAVMIGQLSCGIPKLGSYYALSQGRIKRFGLWLSVPMVSRLPVAVMIEQLSCWIPRLGSCYALWQGIIKQFGLWLSILKVILLLAVVRTRLSRFGKCLH